MTTQRDELATIINDNEVADGGRWTTYPHVTAAAVLAAGYGKPRTVTTVEELDALPVGSVVLCRGRAWSRYVPRQVLGGLIETHKWMCADGGFVRAEKIPDVILPATVLHEPTE